MPAMFKTPYVATEMWLGSEVKQTKKKKIVPPPPMCSGQLSEADSLQSDYNAQEFMGCPNRIAKQSPQHIIKL